jgi:hypothetical protein
MMDKGGVVRDPVPMGAEPISCRSCREGKLGKIVDGKSGCDKCGRVHGFMMIKGKINYGVCL